MIERVAQIVRDGKRFLLATHRGPDADGLGSMVGCAEILRALGKAPFLLLPDGAPESLRHLVGVKEALRDVGKETRFDATFVFDCGDPRLLQGSLPGAPRSGIVVVLDHHRVAVEFGDVCWRNPDEAAVGVMIYRLGKRLGVVPTREAAEALYMAIVADTGGFRYSNTTGEVLRIAAELVDLGADPWRTTQITQESQPPAKLLLLRRVLETLSLSLGSRFATLAVTDDMLRESGATAEMVEGFVNYARAIRGVEVGVLISKKGQSVRASLRGRGAVNVAQVAAQFGGGGHHDAAGCELSAPDVAAARALLERAVAKEMGLEVPAPPEQASADHVEPR